MITKYNLEVKDRPLETKNLTIIRSKWFHGSEDYSAINSTLRNSEGMQCCLGFLAKDCGFDNNDITYRGYPKDIIFDYKVPISEYLKPLIENKYIGLPANTKLTHEIAETNDFKGSQEEREEKVKYLFDTYLNVKVTFVD